MKNRQYGYSWIWLVILFSNAGSVLATPCSGTYYGEAFPNDTPELDTTIGTGFLHDDTVDCCGIITEWELYAGADGALELQVWRLVSGSTDNYELVGENVYNVVLPGSGCDDSNSDSSCFDTVTISVSTADQLSVVSGDRLGWRAAGAEVLSHATKGSYKEVLQKKTNMADFSVGGVTTFSDGTTFHQRYGFRALLSPGSTPTLSGMPTSVTISNSLSVGTTVYTPTASDADTSDTLTFSGTGSASSFFSVDSTTGAVTVATTLNVGTYTMDITVEDPCGSSATGTLTLDVNFPVMEIYNLPNSTTVSEDTTSATTLHTFSTNDPGAGTITCSIPAGVPFSVQTTGSSTVFTIDLSANPNLDYTAQPTYVLNVTCSDTVSSVSADYTVNVQQVSNQAPNLTSVPGSISVPAKTTGSSVSIYNATGTDADNDILTYTMSCASCPFSMSSDGELTTTSSLATETTSSYVLSIYVSDSHTTVGPNNMTIYLTGLNTSPYFSNLPSTISVPESTATGASIFSVAGSDDDVSDSVTISLTTVTPATGSSMFNFNSTDGTVSVSSSALIDYESLSDHNYTVTFSITDGIATVVSQLYIIILNENEAPAFLAPVYYLSSNEGNKGTYLGDPSFTISDGDTGDSHTYTITGGQNYTMVSMNTSTGQIYFAADWDILPANSPLTTQLNVLVTDSGGLTDSAVLELTITHVNQPPTFLNLPQTIYVLEDITSGTTVYSISATDVDGDSFSVSLTNIEASVTSVWEVQGTSVVLKSSANLDYETVQIYNLTFNVFDGIATSTEESLTINVQDMNEAPTFSQTIYYMSASEGLTGDALPSPTYSASDINPDAVITYSIVAGTYSSYFSINSTTGNLYYTIDYIRSHISGDTVNLTIRATDQYGAYSDAEVQLTISYTNVKPTITNLPGNVTIPESTTSGSWIFTVTIEDINNDAITYSVIYSPTSAHSTFSISQTGYSLSISANESLNYETVPVYTLTFTANDGTADSDAGILQINIQDVSEPPVFSSSQYYATVNEDVNGTMVFNSLVVTDADVGDTMSYSILSGTNSEYFRISASGIVYYNVDYDYDNSNFPKTANVTIKATDSTALTATTVLQVTVSDVNDNSPMFDAADYVKAIAESSTVGATILTTTVTDIDSGVNSDVQCSISRPNSVPDIFAISNSGEIILTQSVSAYSGQTFNFNITVTDQGSPSLSDTATVTVIVAATTTTSSNTNTDSSSSSSSTSSSTTDKTALIALGAVAGVALLATIASLAYLAKMRSGLKKAASSVASESDKAATRVKKKEKPPAEKVAKDKRPERNYNRPRTRGWERSQLLSRQSNSSSSTTSSNFEFWNKGDRYFDASNPGSRASPVSIASLSDVDMTSSSRFSSPPNSRVTFYSGHA